MLLAYHATNLLPVMLLSVATELIGNTITATLSTSHVFAEEGFGWDNLGWDIMPWGCPPGLYEKGGLEVPAKFHVEYAIETPRAEPTFFGSPKRLTRKLKTPVWDPILPPIEIWVIKLPDSCTCSHVTTEWRNGFGTHADSLPLAKAAAAQNFNGNSWANDGAGRSPRITYEATPAGDGWVVDFTVYRATYRATITGNVNPEDFPQWSHSVFEFDWFGNVGLPYPIFTCDSPEYLGEFKSLQKDLIIFSENEWSPTIDFEFSIFIQDRLIPFPGEIDITVGLVHPNSILAIYNPKFYDKNPTWEIPIPMPNVFNFSPEPDLLRWPNAPRKFTI